MRRLLVLVSMLMLWVSFASASYISLETAVTTQVRGNYLYVTVTSVNRGDEAAHNVQAGFQVGEEKELMVKWDKLGLDESYKASASFNLREYDPGEYPAIVTMHYTDGNQYPFSAMTCQIFSYGAENIPSEIFGKIISAPFWKKGKVNLTLKNMGQEKLEVSTYLIVPRELTAGEQRYRVSLAPRSEKDVVFGIENFSALAGSSYQVFAITESEKEGFHQTNISTGMISIEKSKKALGMGYTLLITILIVLSLVFVAAQFLGKKKIDFFKFK